MLTRWYPPASPAYAYVISLSLSCVYSHFSLSLSVIRACMRMTLCRSRHVCVAVLYAMSVSEAGAAQEDGMSNPTTFCQAVYVSMCVCVYV